MTHAWAEQGEGFFPLTGTLHTEPDGTPVIVLEVLDVSRETSSDGNDT